MSMNRFVFFDGDRHARFCVSTLMNTKQRNRATADRCTHSALSASPIHLQRGITFSRHHLVTVAMNHHGRPLARNTPCKERPLQLIGEVLFASTSFRMKVLCEEDRHATAGSPRQRSPGQEAS